MTVAYRNTQTLGGDRNAVIVDDMSVYDFTPDFQRFLLALLFFSADIRNNVVEHFRPALEGLAGTGDRLIGTGQYFFQAILVFDRRQGGNVALDGAVGFYGDKAFFGSKTLSLGGNDVHMIRIQFRNDHRNIVKAAMRFIVGDNRDLSFGIGLLESQDLFVFHGNGAEYKVHQRRDLIDMGRVHDDHICH